jgi:hypothetical protein
VKVARETGLYGWFLKEKSTSSSQPNCIVPGAPLGELRVFVLKHVGRIRINHEATKDTKSTKSNSVVKIARETLFLKKKSHKLRPAELRHCTSDSS